MLRALLACLVFAGLQAVETAIRDGERVVFVGDSITGLSVNSGPNGFNGVLRRALDAARPGNRVLNWQRQASVDVLGVDAGDLDDLIVSTVPQQP